MEFGMIQLVTLLSTFAVGVVLSFLGAVKLPLAKRLQINDAQMGGLFTALMFSSTIGVLVSGVAVDMMGAQPVLVFGFLLCGLCVMAIAYSRLYAVVVFACVLLGAGVMSLSSAGGVLAQEVLFPENAAMSHNLNNLFFGLGAFLTPMLVAMLVQKLGYAKTLTVVAVVLLLPLLVAFAAAYPEQVKKAAFDIAPAVQLLAKPAILLAGLVLFCQVALETTLGGWVTTYLSSLGMSESRSGVVLSFFWLMLLVSRLGMVVFHVPVENAVLVVIGTSVVAFFSIGIMMGARTPIIGVLAILVTGLAFGPNFPNMLAVTLERTTKELHGSAYGIIFSIGLLGASIIPAVVGIVSKGKSIQKSMIVPMLTAGAMCVLAIFLNMVPMTPATDKGEPEQTQPATMESADAEPLPVADGLFL